MLLNLSKRIYSYTDYDQSLVSTIRVQNKKTKQKQLNFEKSRNLKLYIKKS